MDSFSVWYTLVWVGTGVVGSLYGRWLGWRFGRRQRGDDTSAWLCLLFCGPIGLVAVAIAHLTRPFWHP